MSSRRELVAACGRTRARRCYACRAVLATLALTAVLAAAPGTARRGNDAIARTKGPVFSVAAAPRIGVLLAGGAQAIQRVGFGAGLQFRVHALRLGPLRIGAGVQLGHTRFLERYLQPASGQQ